MQSIINFLIKLDMVVFQIITLGVAKKNETISAAAWNAHLTGKFWGFSYRLIDPVFALFGQPEHCRQAWLWQQELYK